MPNELVTVFGASGFVGRHTVRALAREGWRIRAVTRRPNLANYLLPAGEVGQIQIVKANVRRDEDVAKALTGASAVVNLTGTMRGLTGPSAINADAAGRIARLAFAAGVTQLVQVSAIGADIEADSSYAWSKGLGERKVSEHFPRATILRPSLIFGPEDNFFNRFAKLARVLPVLPLVGGGHTKFQPVYVRDVATAIARVLADKNASGRTYELGGPATFSFKELIQFILKETGRKRLLMPLPFWLSAIKGFFLQIPSLIFPVDPLLTVDQVRLLKHDNVVRPGAFTLDDLGITPATVESVVPGYLWSFHPKGQFKDEARQTA